MMMRTVTMSLMVGMAVAMTTRPLSHLSVSIDDQIPVTECHSTLANLDTLISQTSSELATLSHQELNIQTVTVTLPRSWNNASCIQGLPLSSLTSIKEADILVKDIEDTDIKTLQFGGCGVRGRRVILPHSRVIPQQNDSTSSSTDLLHSLLKHEFGYFDTHGRVDDPTAQISELYKVGEDGNCNRDPFSDADYKTEAPTKQNLMCQEQSPKSVIASRLLQQKRISEEERPEHKMMIPAQGPSISYLIRQSQRTLLVLDRSQESKHVWKHLHNALYR